MPSRLPLDGPAGVVPVEDLVGPGEDGVDGVVELAALAGGVEIGEPVQGLEGAVMVVGEVEAVQVLESVPSGSESGVRSKELVESGLVGVAEMVVTAQQSEAGSEHFGVKGWCDPVRLATLDVAAHQGQAGGKPAHHTESVEHCGEPVRGGCRWPPCRTWSRRRRRP